MVNVDEVSKIKMGPYATNVTCVIETGLTGIRNLMVTRQVGVDYQTEIPWDVTLMAGKTVL